jgi:hypothetical protein
MDNGNRQDLRSATAKVVRDIGESPRLRALFNDTMQAIDDYKARGGGRQWDDEQLKGLGPYWVVVANPGPGEDMREGMALALGSVTMTERCGTGEALTMAIADIRKRTAALKP